MAQSDIYLRNGKTKAVSDVEVATGRNAKADIELRPKWATVNLGGGDGAKSDGDIKLIDRNENDRIHVDGGGNGPHDVTTTGVYVSGTTPPSQSTGFKHFGDRISVAIDGGSGRISLGGGQTNGEIHLLTEGGGQYYETGTFDAETGSLVAGGGGTSGDHGAVGTLSLRDKFDLDVCRMDAEDASLRLGTRGVQIGGNDEEDEDGEPVYFGGKSGSVRALNTDGRTTAEVRGDEGNLVAGGEETKGAVVLKHATEDGDRVQYLAEASQKGLVLSVTQANAGNNPTYQEALRIDPDGTVRVKGGSVKQL